MSKHWKGVLALAVLSIVAVVLGLAYSPLVGVVAFSSAVVGWFVVGIAWMTPRGYVEHDDPPKPDHTVRSVAHHRPEPKAPYR